jgi:hypothetical protein
MRDTVVSEVNQLLVEISDTTDYFYQQKIGEAYKKLDPLIGHIMTVVDKLFAYKETYSLMFDEDSLVNSLAKSMKAVEEKDSVLLADILSLELAGQLEDIVSNIVIIQ